MNTGTVETTDIFHCAFYLCNGADLCGVRIKHNGRPIGSFQIKGEGLAALDKEYRNGKALVNPLQLRESLNYLRNILFDKLQETGREKNDRKRKNRSAQRAY